GRVVQCGRWCARGGGGRVWGGGEPPADDHNAFLRVDKSDGSSLVLQIYDAADDARRQAGRTRLQQLQGLRQRRRVGEDAGADLLEFLHGLGVVAEVALGGQEVQHWD